MGGNNVDDVEGDVGRGEKVVAEADVTGAGDGEAAWTAVLDWGPAKFLLIIDDVAKAWRCCCCCCIDDCWWDCSFESDSDEHF